MRYYHILFWTIATIIVSWIINNSWLAIISGLLGLVLAAASYSIERKEQHQFKAVSSDVKEYVMARQLYKCAIPECQERNNLHLHHIKPRSEGGSNEIGNLMYVCPNHHAEIHRRLRERGYTNG